MKPRTLPALLTSASAAVVYGKASIPAAALDTASRRFARGLHGIGVRSGDRVGLWLPNTHAWLTAFFACAHLGAIAFAINTRFRAAEIGDVIHRAGIRTLVFWPGFRQIGFERILADVPREALGSLKQFIVYSEDAAPHAPKVIGKPAFAWADIADADALAESHAAPDAPCVIFTTSGTTRLPKFVMHSQESIASHSADIARAFEMDTPGAAVLLTIPLCGTFGLSHALSGLSLIHI